MTAAATLRTKIGRVGSAVSDQALLSATNLLAGVDTPLVTHWGFLALHATPGVLLIARAVRTREPSSSGSK